jgi:indolepyruvate ferredoxin oxidoreductase alpha subunit
MKKILSGNEAIARGAYEYGVHVATAYPGTPSTEILENVGRHYPEIVCEWSPNEKVALEVAAGATFVGARTLTTMKHVGVNVAADPLFSMAYIGARGGMVLVSADDPGMHSSQNEQDNRHFARHAKIPCLEPSDSQECKDFVGAALDISERFDTPVLLRTTTRVNHSASVVELGERKAIPPKGYVKDVAKNVTLPGNARKAHVKVEKRLDDLAVYGCDSPLNRVEMGSTAIGVVTSGISYQYVKEILPEASVLKLGLTFPLPEKLIRDFAAKVEKLFVVEELDPFLEDQIKAMGIACEGKKIIPELYELNPNIVARSFGKQLYQDRLSLPEDTKVPNRPPVLCPGCPHRSVFFALKKARVVVTGDIGCYTLGAMAPLGMIDTCICMGASIGASHGMQLALGKEKWQGKSVAVIGDSTFLHSGIQPLMDVVYNGGTTTTVILDNSITAMTGHQDNPGTGKTLRGEPAPKVDLEALCRAVGVEHVRVVDALDNAAVEQAIKEEIARPAPSVIIARSPCIFVDDRKRTPWQIDGAVCNSCGACMRIGCPGIAKTADGKYAIDQSLCTDCSLCSQVCRADAIHRIAE